jgi:hypothetical protein
MVNITPLPLLTREKNSGTYRTGGWVGQKGGLAALKKKNSSCGLVENCHVSISVQDVPPCALAHLRKFFPTNF